MRTRTQFKYQLADKYAEILCRAALRLGSSYACQENLIRIQEYTRRQGISEKEYKYWLQTAPNYFTYIKAREWQCFLKGVPYSSPFRTY